MNKSKRFLSIIMAVCMMIGVVSVGFTAMAASTLQGQIDAAPVGGVVTLTRGTTASVTISKDLTLDLGGYALCGVKGSSAITVTNGADVNICNGHVYSYFANVSSLEMIKTLRSNCKPAIKIASGNVALYGVFADGTQVRIPTTTNMYSGVPAGNAVEMSAGTTLRVERSALVGRWGLSNNKDARVTIVDGVFAGFMSGIKYESAPYVTYDDTKTTRTSASDMVSHLVPYGVTLEEDEAAFIARILGQRGVLYVQNPVIDVDTTYENGTLTVTGKVDNSQMAEDIEYSYKWIPESVKVNGQTKYFQKVDANTYYCVFNNVPLTAVGNTDSLDVRYRLFFGLNATVKDFLVNFVDTVEDFYNKLPAKLNKYFADFMDGYEGPRGYIAAFADIYYKIDTMSAPQEIAGQVVNITSAVPEIKELLGHLFLIGGETLYNYINTNINSEYEFYPELAEYFGYTDPTYLLDGIDPIIQGLNDFAPIDFSEDLSGMIFYLYDHYEEVLDLLDVAEGYLDNIIADLNTEIGQYAIDYLELGEYVDLINDVAGYIDDAQVLIDKVLANDYYQRGVGYIDRNRTTLEGYVDKAVDVIENLDKYVSFTIVDDTANAATGWLKLYSFADTAEYTAREVVESAVTVQGGGTINYTSSFEDGATNNATVAGYYKDTEVTLEAVPNAGCQFLYWSNKTTNRILSTDPSYKIRTNAGTEIEAVFNDTTGGLSTVAFANMTGDIVESYQYDGDTVWASFEEPYIPRYSFVAWPGANADGEISIADVKTKFSAYDGVLKGSAFDETNDNYNNAILKFHLDDDNNILFIPNYELSGEVTITYFNGISTSTKAAKLYSTVKLSAAVIPGSTFSYWQDADNNIASIYPEYSFTAVEDETFTAVYDVAAPLAVARISAVYDDATASTLSFYMERSVANVYTVVRSGVILTYDATLGANDAAFILGSTGLVGTAKNYDRAGTYCLTKSAYVGAPIYGRAYLEVKDATGAHTFIYSDIVSFAR